MGKAPDDAPGVPKAAPVTLTLPFTIVYAFAVACKSFWAQFANFSGDTR
jgi:hypothetical protein